MWPPGSGVDQRGVPELGADGAACPHNREQGRSVRDPAQVLDLVEKCTGKLDTLSKMLADAHDEKTISEEEWDVVKDAVAESLHDEYREAGRKADPADHTIISAARRAHRTVYQRMRRARIEVDKLEEVALTGGPN